MSRGRPPRVGLDEALEIAGRRGEVRPAPSKRGDAYDFIIFEKFRTVFVKMKRSLTMFTYPYEVLCQYQREVAQVHRVPLTQVTAREFWFRSPRGKWQFFLIRHDSIVEIRADGMYIPMAELPPVVADEEMASDDGREVTPDTEE
jgi:hypothetical protein